MTNLKFKNMTKLSLIISSILLGFAIPISTALENIMSGIYLILTIMFCWLSQSFHCEQNKTVFNNSFVCCCLLLYLWLLWGSFYSIAPIGSTLHMLVKMRNYLFVPLIFIASQKVGRYLLYGFGFGVIVNLFLSFTTWLINHPILQGADAGGRFTVFRSHTYHTIFIALFLVGIITPMLMKLFNKKIRWIFGFIALLGVFEVLFINDSRTGFIMILFDLFLLLLLWRVKQGLLYSILILFFTLIVVFSSSIVKERLKTTVINTQQYNNGTDIDTPIGVRYFFHQISKKLIKIKPLLGYGTGSFVLAYHNYVEKNHLAPKDSSDRITDTHNPHNDYLWLGVELGIPGILILISIIVSLIYESCKLAKPESFLGIILAVTYAVVSFENSFFTDNVSGLAFVFLACAVLGGNLYPRKPV